MCASEVNVRVRACMCGCVRAYVVCVRAHVRGVCERVRVWVCVCVCMCGARAYVVCVRAYVVRVCARTWCVGVGVGVGAG